MRGTITVTYTYMCGYCDQIRTEKETGRYGDVWAKPYRGPWHLVDGVLACEAHTVTVEDVATANASEAD